MSVVEVVSFRLMSVVYRGSFLLIDVVYLYSMYRGFLSSYECGIRVSFLLMGVGYV